MGDYKKCGSTVIEGKKRTLYSKVGTTKKYVQRKGRMMNVIKYKKMVEKKAAKAKAAAPKRVKSTRKARKSPKRHGGYEESKAENLLENVMRNISM
jgi:hypothetical protein